MNREKLRQWRESGREMLSAAATPTSLNEEQRTVDCIWFTGAEVPRMDWWTGEMYILRFDPAGVDLSLLNNGAPVLDSHDDWEGVAGQLGRVEKAWTQDGQYLGTLRFSRRPDVDGTWQDVRDGIVSKFSMGVTILACTEERDQAGKLVSKTATKWQPFEISVTPIPADFGTTTLSAYPADNRAPAQPQQKEGHEMLTENKPGEVARNEVNEAALRAEGARMERERLTGIDQAAAVFLKRGEIDGAFLERVKAEGKSVDEVKLAIHEVMARRSDQPENRTQPNHPANLEGVRDERDSRVELMSNALLHRFQPGTYKLETEARQYRGMSLLRIAEECLMQAGLKTRGMTPDEIATHALLSGGAGTFTGSKQLLSGVGGIGTSDLPFITANVANKVLRKAYEANAQTFKPFSRQATSTDFKLKYVTQFGDAPSLDKVNQNGEFNYGKIGEARESYGLVTYGKIVPFTRQAIINDDMGAFTRLPELQGKAAARKESDVVWALITGNPTMGDGITLFHASHGNLIASGTAISVDSFGVARAAMRIQKGLGSVEQLDLTPKFVLVPAAKEQLALQYTSANYTPALAGSVNPYAGMMMPIVEPRLDADSSTAWYMVADPAQTDTLEYSYLEGQEGAYLETRVGWNIDGVEFKCRLDFGAAIIDWRAFTKNVGA